LRGRNCGCCNKAQHNAGHGRCSCPANDCVLPVQESRTHGQLRTPRSRTEWSYG
jgi:hypothetical protein